MRDESQEMNTCEISRNPLKLGAQRLGQCTMVTLKKVAERVYACPRRQGPELQLYPTVVRAFSGGISFVELQTCLRWRRIGLYRVWVPGWVVHGASFVCV